MGTAPMWRLLATMSVPPTLAIVVMAMYSIVDRAFVGNAVGVDALSGLSAAFPAQLLAVGLGLLTGLGGMSVISRALGARNVALASRVVGSALAITVPLYLVVAVVGLTQLQSLVDLMGASTETAVYARQYLVIILPGSLLVMVSMTCNNFLMAEGRPPIAMLLMAGGAVINIALDALFVLVLGWGVSGAAAATVISQGVAVGYMVWFYLSGTQRLENQPRCAVPQTRADLADHYVGSANLHHRGCPQFLVVVINNILSGYANGDGYIALFGAINSVLELALAPFIGVALAYLPLAAYNYGARRYDRVRQAIWQSCVGAVIAGAILIGVIAAMSAYVIRIFAEPGALPAEASSALRVVLIALPIVGVEFVSSISFQALGKAWQSVALTITQRVIFLLAFLSVMSATLGVWGVWWSFPATDIAATLLGCGALAIVWRRAERWGEADYIRASADFDIAGGGQ